jgi:putative salt-induced outer membrane protein YdiY
LYRLGKCLCAVAVTLLAGSTAVPPLLAQEEAKPKWSDVAEFSYVATSGNSESSTLGLKNSLKRVWDKNTFELKAGAIRAESTARSWTVQPSGSIREESTTTVAAENYYLNGQYDRKITDKFFWNAGAGWERNPPAGVDNRYWGSGGVGNIWVDTDPLKFRTDYSLTYTKEQDTVEPPGFKDKYLGARFSWSYLHKFGANTTYGNDFRVDENLDDTGDLRGDMTNSVAVSMSEKLALKVGLQWLYRRRPAYVEADDPGNVTVGPDLVQLDSLDSIFTASLIVKF